MGSIKSMVEKLIPGIYVRSLMIGNNVIEVGMVGTLISLGFIRFSSCPSPRASEK